MKTDWDKLPNFSPEEFDYPDKLRPRLLYMVQYMRDRENNRRGARGQVPIIIVIKNDFRPEDPLSHGKGEALDMSIKDQVTKRPLPVLEQFWIGLHYFFTGLGFYPFWAEPGIHADIRPMSLYQRRATWWRDKAGEYRATHDFFEMMGGTPWG